MATSKGGCPPPLTPAAHPSDPDVAGESHGKSSGPTQLPGHWQSSTDDILSQQSQQNEPLHLHSSEQRLSQTEQIEQGSSAIDQHEHASNRPESGQELLHSEQSYSDHQQMPTETNSFQLVEKDQAKNPDLNPVQELILERTQHSESQRQPATQQLSNQQVSGANDANNPMRRMGTVPTIPFRMLIPILRPNLDNDRSLQLHSVFSKLRSSEIGKEDFIRVIRNIFGDQALRQAAHKVQLQLQAEAAQNQQTNPNQCSLLAQAASQQLSSCGAQFMPHPVSAQNQKGQKSPPRQSHVPPSSVQMQTGTEFPNLENNAGESSHGKSSGPTQLPGHWHSSTDDNLSQQSQQNEPLHLHSLEQQLSQTEQIEQGCSAIDQHEHASNQPETGQELLHSEQSYSDHQQLPTETNFFQLVEKDQANNPDLNPVQEAKLERTQHSESQRQSATQQLNNQQVSGADDANNPMRRMGTLPTIPFRMLIPILRPNLDKDRSMQLHSAFSKLRSSEIGREDFLRVIRTIFGDKELRQAAHKVQLQLQAEAAQNQQTNPNQYSLQAQADSQQLSSCGAQVMPHPVSAQNQKGLKSPPRQSHVPPSSAQMQTGTEFPNLENSGTRSREVENKQDVHSTNMNIINPERQSLAVPLPSNKQQ